MKRNNSFLGKLTFNDQIFLVVFGQKEGKEIESEIFLSQFLKGYSSDQ